jgi:hypothetical protein
MHALPLVLPSIPDKPDLFQLGFAFSCELACAFDAFVRTSLTHKPFTKLGAVGISVGDAMVAIFARLPKQLVVHVVPFLLHGIGRNIEGLEAFSSTLIHLFLRPTFLLKANS